MAALDSGGQRESRTQALRVIDQKFTSEWVTIVTTVASTL